MDQMCNSQNLHGMPFSNLLDALKSNFSHKLVDIPPEARPSLFVFLALPTLFHSYNLASNLAPVAPMFVDSDHIVSDIIDNYRWESCREERFRSLHENIHLRPRWSLIY